MLDELGKEMCEATINRFDPDYITMDNPNHDGRYVATNVGWDIGEINTPQISNPYPMYCPYCGRKISYWNFGDLIDSPIYTTAINNQGVK